MKKPLLLSLATLAVIGSDLSANNTMYERFQEMELQVKQMKQELKTLKAQEKESAAATKKILEAQNAAADEDEETDDDESIADQLADMQESIGELNRNTNSNHLKFNVDYRFALDNLSYTMADGSTLNNDAFMTNRFWLNMSWAATKHLSFHGQLAYNKAFGERSGISAPGYETFDWITNENAYDGTLRVKNLYFLYKNDSFIGADVPWTFSIGRRPSTNGHLVNLRDDDHASSPMGHSINVEFDGLSAKFGLENLTSVDGMYIKFCAGRGMSNAAPRFSPAPFADTTSNPSIDLAGFLFTPWDNGQYSINTQYYYANNLIDVNSANTGFDTVGDMDSITANFTANGIGDEISDYLDDTIFFVSWAMNITHPDKGKGMLGSATDKSKKGYSYWVGLQMPSVVSEEGRWGVEYNHGTKFWRSITYAEDTNIGSKLAARGDAYEAYFTEPLIDDILSLQVRYTYIDYKYAGSNGFFGNTSGDSSSISSTMANASAYVDKAQDIRFYIRYRY